MESIENYVLNKGNALGLAYVGHRDSSPFNLQLGGVSKGKSAEPRYVWHWAQGKVDVNDIHFHPHTDQWQDIWAADTDALWACVEYASSPSKKALRDSRCVVTQCRTIAVSSNRKEIVAFIRRHVPPKFASAPMLFEEAIDKNASQVEVGDGGIASSSEYAKAGLAGKAIVGRWGTAIAGAYGYAEAGDCGTAKTGDRGRASVGVRGTAYAGTGGTAIAGDSGTAISENQGRAFAGDNGTAITGGGGGSVTRKNGFSQAGDWGYALTGGGGTAKAGRLGRAGAGDGGQAWAGDGGNASAGVGGTLYLGYFNQEGVTWIMCKVGERGIKPYVSYKLSEDRLPIPCPTPWRLNE